ncbi:MAG: Trm112 family protein [Verrucomicrobiae bacterium]|nr:Trm112 family protein [Verrucomicrobiae bacterium]
MIDPALLDILACPNCKTAVKLEGDRLVCQKPACGLRYPIRNGIPIMLIEEAEKPPEQAKTG